MPALHFSTTSDRATRLDRLDQVDGRESARASFHTAVDLIGDRLFFLGARDSQADFRNSVPKVVEFHRQITAEQVELAPQAD